jgi:hypothetical protein
MSAPRVTFPLKVMSVFVVKLLFTVIPPGPVRVNFPVDIAKEIVRAHNGWIHVSSPGVGKGTTFMLELPLVEKSKSA